MARTIGFLLLLGLVGTVFGLQEVQYKQEFSDFIAKYEKFYEDEEFVTRYQIFKKNLDKINQHNADGASSFTMAMNQFGDLSHQEFLETLGSLDVPSQWESSDDFDENKVVDAPSSWDWRSKGAVTPVIQQGPCGASPYFSAVASLEGCHQIGTGDLVALSVQNIIDCPSNGDEGCTGGFMIDAFELVMQEKGIDTNTCYPYTGEGGNNCHFNPEAPCCGSTMKNYVNVTSGSEAALLQAVLKAPVASAMDSSQDSFQFYSSGIYEDAGCSSSNIDHGIPVIGYGVNATGAEYWILKNSFGKNWGINGYLWLARNKNNMCGVATTASYAMNCGNC